MSIRGAHLYVDCFSGAAGDMLLGALLDLGVPRAVVDEAIAALGFAGIHLHARSVRRGGLVGCKIDVHHHGEDAHDAHGVAHHEHDHAHVPYREIRERLTRLPPEASRRAIAIFDRVATVESRRHGIPLADVAFHELGAADSIADIAGTAAALAWLAPASVTCRPIPLGGGTVRTAHGALPVPAPATLELLTGCAVEAGGDSELTTPTGAAVLSALLAGFAEGAPPAGAFGSLPPGVVRATGWGAGTRELRDRPNLVRLVAYDRADASSTDVVEQLEANLDDLSPELVAPLVDALLSAGALDAWIQPVVMKKGRPAFVVTALCRAERVPALEALLFRESTTLGVRRSTKTRSVLDRHVLEVQTPYGAIAVKVGGRLDASRAHFTEIFTIAPELESCRGAAAATESSLKDVYAAAQAVATELRAKLLR